MTDEQVQKLKDLCDNTVANLNELKSQLDKIIKKSDTASGNMEVIKAKTDLNSLNNLKQIDEILPQTIEKVRKLSQKASMLYVEQFDVQKSPGIENK